MTDLELSSSGRKSKLKWAWFTLGCSCLLVGGVYLGLVDLTGAQVSAETENQDATLTSNKEVTDSETAEALSQ
ncbi:MAG: hypothetical protein AAGJ95_07205 [Cyanobacteria bacterium J06554_11]